MVVRIGGKEESGQSTINEEKDGGRAEGKPMRDSGRTGGIEEEEAWEALIILNNIIPVFLMTLVVEDRQTCAVPQGSLDFDHATTEGDTSWLRGDAALVLRGHLSILCCSFPYHHVFSSCLFSGGQNLLHQEHNLSLRTQEWSGGLEERIFRVKRMEKSRWKLWGNHISLDKQIS